MPASSKMLSLSKGSMALKVTESDTWDVLAAAGVELAFPWLMMVRVRFMTQLDERHSCVTTKYVACF